MSSEIGTTKRVADNHVFPTDEMGCGIETLRQGVSRGVAVKDNGGRGNGLQERLVGVAFSARKAMGDQINQQRLTAPGWQKCAGAGRDSRVAQRAGREKEAEIGSRRIGMSVIAAPGKIAQQIGTASDECRGQVV